MKTAHIADGIIEGALINAAPRGRDCEYCGELNLFLVSISKITLPEPMTPANSLMLYVFKDTELVSIEFIGIGCGCYAKAHRQITHVADLMKSRQRAQGHDPASPRHRIN